MDGPGNFATLDGATTMTRVQFLWRLVLAFLVGTAFTVVCVAYLSVSQGDGKAVGRVVHFP